MQRIQEDIKNRSFHPVYLLFGEESYLVRTYRDRLKQAVLDGADEMNYSNFQGSGIDLQQVREIADTLPFFQDYRIIVMEDTKLFQSANDFADYLPTMPDTTIVVFAEKQVDKRNKLYKYVQKNGLAVEMSQMNAADTKRFVAVKLRDNGRKIRESTAEYLLEQIDNSLNNVENELDKLIAYTYGREEITKEDIDTVCSVQVTGQIFKMLDAVAAGRKQEMLALYHDLLALRESPMSILYLLTRHFNILLQIKTAAGGLSKQELAKKAGIPPFAVGKYQSQCKNFSKEQLVRMLTRCADTEFDFKQGKLSDQIGVEMLLVEFSGALSAK
jgi:DNA polymerase-3 subunit delta